MEQVSARGMGTESRVNKVVFGCFCMNLYLYYDRPAHCTPFNSFETPWSYITCERNERDLF